MFILPLSYKPDLLNYSDWKKHIILSAEWADKVMDRTCQRDTVCIHIVQYI